MRSTLFVCLVFVGLFCGYSQEADVVSPLVELGFENVSSIRRGSDLYVSYENNVYRFEAKGLAHILTEFADTDLSLYHNIHLLLRSQDIPMVLVSFSVSDFIAYNNGLISPYVLTSRMKFSFDVDKVETLFSNTGSQNSSFYKVDIPVGVALDYLLGDFNAPVQTRTYVDTRVLSTFGRGTEFEFEFRNIVQNQIPGTAISSPTIVKITQSERLGNNSFITASLGYLPQGKFGLHSRFRNYLAQERFYIEFFYGITRRGYLDQNWNVINNRNSDAIWQAIFNYRWNKFDTDFNFTYGNFYAGDLGYKIQITRQFNEVYVNLFYGRTDILSVGSFGSTEEGIVGFSLTVPFGQSKFLKPTFFRARTNDNFNLLYRYSGFSLSGLDILQGSNIFSDIREFYPEVLRKGLLKHL